MDAFARLELVFHKPLFYNSLHLCYNNFVRNTELTHSSLIVCFVAKLTREICYNTVLVRSNEDEGLGDCASFVLFAIVKTNKFTTEKIKRSVSVYEFLSTDEKLVISYEKNVPEMEWLRNEMRSLYSQQELILFQIIQIA